MSRCGSRAENEIVSEQNMSDTKMVFVTVGTYKFDELVEAVTKRQFQEVGWIRFVASDVVQVWKTFVCVL